MARTLVRFLRQPRSTFLTFVHASVTQILIDQKNIYSPFDCPHSPSGKITSGYPYGGNAGCRANTPDRVSSATFSPPVPLSTQVSFSETLSTLALPDTAADGAVLAPVYEVEADYICESIRMRVFMMHLATMLGDDILNDCTILCSFEFDVIDYNSHTSPFLRNTYNRHQRCCLRDPRHCNHPQWPCLRGHPGPYMERTSFCPQLDQHADVDDVCRWRTASNWYCRPQR